MMENATEDNGALSLDRTYSRVPKIEAILNFVESHDDIMASVSNLLAHRIIEDDEILINLAADL